MVQSIEFRVEISQVTTMACWRLSSTTIFTFSNSLMVNSIEENASKSVVVLKIQLFLSSSVRITLKNTFSNFRFGGWQIRAAVMYSMHVSIAASICFWIAGTLFPYCWACTTKHDCNKIESAKNFAIFLSSRELIFSLWEDRVSLTPFIGWRIGQDHTYIDGAICNFTT